LLVFGTYWRLRNRFQAVVTEIEAVFETSRRVAQEAQPQK